MTLTRERYRDLIEARVFAPESLAAALVSSR